MTAVLEREKQDVGTSGMTHIAETPSRYLCGKERNTAKRPAFLPHGADCVVCESLWAGLSDQTRVDIYYRVMGL